MAAAKLSPAQAAAELLARDDASRLIEAYIRYMELGFEPVAHHKLLLRELEALERGECTRLMVFMPPGSAKSVYASATFPAWYMGRNPTKSVIACSHTQELAERFGRRVRNNFATVSHRNVFGVGVSADNQAAGRWETEKGGEYFAAGIGGSVTGRRADLAIIDDPVKSREDADSDIRRDRVWDWYLNDFRPRLKPSAAEVLIMTRWHDDDLAGRLLDCEGSDWRVLEIPMEALPDDPLGRKVGDRLWPEWFTPDQVEQAKRDVRTWNALYQQRPASEEGDYFKADWFGEYEKIPPGCAKYGASDYAVTEGGGDYTEHGMFAVDAWSNIYITDWWRDQTTSDVWIEKQCDLVLQHSPDCWFGESGPIRRAVEPYLLRRMTERRAFVRVEWLPSLAEKTARARPFQALCSMGKVFLPKEARWKAELMGQLLRFPAAKYDDGVDVCSLIGRGLEKIQLPRIRKPSEFRPVPRVLSDGSNTGWMAQ